MNFGWQIDASRATEIVREAIESDVRFFDTSVSYGRGASETMLGDILHGMRRRKHVVIATKFGSPATQDARDDELGNGRLNVIRHCELSLSRLKTDYLDLFQMHHFDETTPFDETFSALDALLRQGKVRRVGLCNLRGSQLADAAACAGMHDKLVLHSHQVRFSLLDRSAEAEVLAKAHALGMRNMAYAPLAEGFLSGQYRFAEAFPEASRFGLASSTNQYERRFTADLAARLARIGEVARDCGIAMATLALSWLADRADVDKILVGASSAAQVRAIGTVPRRLDEEIRRRLDEIVPPGTCYA